MNRLSSYKDYVCKIEFISTAVNVIDKIMLFVHFSHSFTTGKLLLFFLVLDNRKLKMTIFMQNISH